MATIRITDEDAARSQRLTWACEVVRADGRGETTDPAELAEAWQVVNEAAAPPSYDEQQHRLAMRELVDEANRMHRATRRVFQR